MPTQTEKPRATIYDVAREIGISKSTVARVLTGSGRVSAQTAELVLDAARRMGYEADEQAQRLAKGRFENIVDVFAQDLDYGVLLRRVRAIHGLLQKQGLDVSTHVSGRSPGAAARTINKLRRRRPYAIVAHAWGAMDEQSLEELRLFMAEGGTLVCLGCNGVLPLGCDQVLFDEERNTYLAAKHLLEAGHRRIGYNSHDDSNPQHPRILGMKAALQEYGLELNPEWTFHSWLYEDGGAELAEKFLKLRDRPTAMCVNNDVSAATFVHVLARHGIGVPEDVSVIGFDDSPAARNCLVPLTAMSQPTWEDGQLAVNHLLSRRSGEYAGEPRITVSSGELVERVSVKRLD